MSVGVKIRQLREKNKLSQYELADALEITQTNLHNIESGNSKKIDFILIDKICKYFGVEFEYFLEKRNVFKFEKVENSNIHCEIGVLNSFPENLIQQITQLINENKIKEIKIQELEEKISKLKIKE